MHYFLYRVSVVYTKQPIPSVLQSRVLSIAISLCRDTAAAAMQFLAHVDGLIFDLRENQGRDPHVVAFMASNSLITAHI
jgi:hypothetical protein